MKNIDPLNQQPDLFLSKNLNGFLYLVPVLFLVATMFAMNFPDTTKDTKKSTNKITSNKKTKPQERSKITIPIDNNWYNVDNLSKKCEKSEGPAPMIEAMQNIGEQYKTSDITENNRIVQVKLMFLSRNMYITYYRGASRCQSINNRNKAIHRSEANKYR